MLFVQDVIVGSGVLISVSGIMSSVAPNFAVFLVGRFLMGIGGMGTFQITFVLGEYKLD